MNAVVNASVIEPQQPADLRRSSRSTIRNPKRKRHGVTIQVDVN